VRCGFPGDHQHQDYRERPPSTAGGAQCPGRGRRTGGGEVGSPRQGSNVKRHRKLNHFRHRKLNHPEAVFGLGSWSGSTLMGVVSLAAHGIRDGLRWLSFLVDAGGQFPLRPPWLASVAVRRRCQPRRSRPQAGEIGRLCVSP